MLPCSRAIDCDSDYPHQTIIWCDDMIWWYDKIYNIYSQNVYIVYIVYILLFSVIITVLSSKTAWFLWKPGIYISDFTISQPILFHILKQVLLYQKFPPLPRNGRRRTTRLRCLWCFRVFGRAPKFCRTGVEGSEMQLVIHVHTVLNQKKDKTMTWNMNMP